MARRPATPTAVRPPRHELVTVQVAAEFVGVHPVTIRRWINAGLLTAYTAGPRLIRLDLDQVEAVTMRTR